jgi:hypothetical protein
VITSQEDNFSSFVEEFFFTVHLKRRSQIFHVALVKKLRNEKKDLKVNEKDLKNEKLIKRKIYAGLNEKIIIFKWTIKSDEKIELSEQP